MTESWTGTELISTTPMNDRQEISWFINDWYRSMCFTLDFSCISSGLRWIKTFWYWCSLFIIWVSSLLLSGCRLGDMDQILLLTSTRQASSSAGKQTMLISQAFKVPAIIQPATSGTTFLSTNSSSIPTKENTSSKSSTSSSNLWSWPSSPQLASDTSNTTESMHNSFASCWWQMKR